ncbi:hypothetical protein B0H14DRAFT_3860836 [Mycena olivaceomarginata]|nr:hypothetical protein B0H14DRAFT_3860836 [Mycena olivaceomarginata]
MLDTRELARSSGAFALLLAPTTATKISQLLICPNSRLTRPTPQNHRKADLVPRYAPPIHFAPFGYSEMCVRDRSSRVTHCSAVHRDICVGKIVELNIQFIDTSRVQRRLEMGTNLISAPPPRFVTNFPPPGSKCCALRVPELRAPRLAAIIASRSSVAVSALQSIGAHRDEDGTLRVHDHNALQHQHQHHSWDNNNTAFQNAAQRAPTSLVDIHLGLVDGTRPRRTASAHAPISRSRPELGPSLSCAHHCRLTLHSRAARDTIGRGGARSPLKSNGYGNRGAHSSSIHPVARAPYALICGGGTTSWSLRAVGREGNKWKRVWTAREAECGCGESTSEGSEEWGARRRWGRMESTRELALSQWHDVVDASRDVARAALLFAGQMAAMLVYVAPLHPLCSLIIISRSPPLSTLAPRLAHPHLDLILLRGSALRCGFWIGAITTTIWRMRAGEECGPRENDIPADVGRRASSPRRVVTSRVPRPILWRSPTLLVTHLQPPRTGSPRPPPRLAFTSRTSTAAQRITQS